MMKKPRIYNGRRTAYSMNDVGKIGQHMQKNGTTLLSYAVHKN